MKHMFYYLFCYSILLFFCKSVTKYHLKTNEHLENGHYVDSTRTTRGVCSVSVLSRDDGRQQPVFRQHEAVLIDYS